MAGETRQYSPDKMLWTWAAVVSIPGLDFNEINLRPGLVRANQVSGGRTNQTWEVTNDDSDNAEFSKDPRTNGTLAFTYSYGAITNTLLAGLRQADELTSLGIGTIEGKDLNGQTLIVGRGARLQGSPAITFGPTADSRQKTWTFLIANLNDFQGGLDIIG